MMIKDYTTEATRSSHGRNDSGLLFRQVQTAKHERQIFGVSLREGRGNGFIGKIVVSLPRKAVTDFSWSCGASGPRRQWWGHRERQRGRQAGRDAGLNAAWMPPQPPGRTRKRHAVRDERRAACNPPPCGVRTPSQ